MQRICVSWMYLKQSYRTDIPCSILLWFCFSFFMGSRLCRIWMRTIFLPMSEAVAIAGFPSEWLFTCAMIAFQVLIGLEDLGTQLTGGVCWSVGLLVRRCLWLFLSLAFFVGFYFWRIRVRAVFFVVGWTGAFTGLPFRIATTYTIITLPYSIGLGIAVPCMSSSCSTSSPSSSSSGWWVI